MSEVVGVGEGHVDASVQVSPDGLELYLAVADPWRYSRDQLVELLRGSGYAGPLDEGGLDTLSRGDAAGVPVRVICGTAPVAGSDEEFYYHFDSLKPRAKHEAETSEQEPFAIDHRESRKIDRCEAGDVLVRIVREKDPVEGVDVWGREVQPPRGKELKLQGGQNVTLGPDGRSLVAAIAGVPTREPSGRISVARSLVVQGVDFKSGNIHFDGSVSIEGDIASGFVVEATADVEIKGSIEHATVRAGGSILVKGGVRRQSKLTAAGSIEVRFVDSESHLEARATVTVAQDAIQSELVGDEGVFIGGQLVGGVARSAMHIQVGALGCPRDTPTRAIIDRPLTPAKVQLLKEELGLAVPQERSGPSAEEIAAQGNSLLRLGNTARVVSARPAAQRPLAPGGRPLNPALRAAGVPNVPVGSSPPSSGPESSRPAPPSSPPSSLEPKPPSTRAPESVGAAGRTPPPSTSAAPGRPSGILSARTGAPVPARPGSIVVPTGPRPGVPGRTVAPGANPSIRMPAGGAPLPSRTNMPGPGRLAPPKPLGAVGSLPAPRIGVATTAPLPKTGAGKPLVTSRIEELAKLATVALYDQIAVLPPSANGRIVATTTVRPGVTLVMSQVTRAIDLPLGPRAFRMEESVIHEAILGPAT